MTRASRVFALLTVTAFVVLSGSVPALASTSGRSHEGGYSISGATVVKGTRTVKQPYIVGEYLFWKVPLPAGRSVKVEATIDFGDSYPNFITDMFIVKVFNPLLEHQMCGDNTDRVMQDNLREKVTVSCETAFTGGQGGYTGPYYVSVAVAEPSGDARGMVKQLTVDFTVRDGTHVVPPPTPTPTQAPAGGGSGGSGGTAKAAATGESASAGNGVSATDIGVPAGGAVVGIGLGTLLAYLITRLRRRPAPSMPGTAGPPPGQPGWGSAPGQPGSAAPPHHLGAFQADQPSNTANPWGPPGTPPSQGVLRPQDPGWQESAAQDSSGYVPPGSAWQPDREASRSQAQASQTPSAPQARQPAGPPQDAPAQGYGPPTHGTTPPGPPPGTAHPPAWTHPGTSQSRDQSPPSDPTPGPGSGSQQLPERGGQPQEGNSPSGAARQGWAPPMPPPPGPGFEGPPEQSQSEALYGRPGTDGQAQDPRSQPPAQRLSEPPYEGFTTDDQAAEPGRPAPRDEGLPDPYRQWRQ